MESGLFARGILLEIDNDAIDLARQNQDERVLYLAANASDGLSQLQAKLAKLTEDHVISGALFSFHSVLHELPSRASGFDLSLYFDNLAAMSPRRAIVLREPCKPAGWPSSVELRSSEITAATLRDLAMLVAGRRRMPEPGALTPRSGVVMNSDLAIETLFKLFYAYNLEHELGETVTAFSVDDFKNSLLRCFEPNSITSKTFSSPTFEAKFREFGMRVFANEDLKEQTIPEMFVRCAAYHL